MPSVLDSSDIATENGEAPPLPNGNSGTHKMPPSDVEQILDTAFADAPDGEEAGDEDQEDPVSEEEEEAVTVVETEFKAALMFFSLASLLIRYITSHYTDFDDHNDFLSHIFILFPQLCQKERNAISGEGAANGSSSAFLNTYIEDDEEESDFDEDDIQVRFLLILP